VSGVSGPEADPLQIFETERDQTTKCKIDFHCREFNRYHHAGVRAVLRSSPC